MFPMVKYLLSCRRIFTKIPSKWTGSTVGTTSLEARLDETYVITPPALVALSALYRT